MLEYIKLLSFWIIVRHCFCLQLYFWKALLISTAKTNHLTPNLIKLQSAIVVDPGTHSIQITLNLNTICLISEHSEGILNAQVN